MLGLQLLAPPCHAVLTSLASSVPAQAAGVGMAATFTPTWGESNLKHVVNGGLAFHTSRFHIGIWPHQGAAQTGRQL